MKEFDLIVIGGGSAGLKSARTAARQGRRVALAEERELGGECFWAGCVPTKAMVRAAQVWHLVRNVSRFGMEVDIRKSDFQDAMRYRQQCLKTISGDGPADGGLSKLGAGYYPTRAVFEGSNEIRVGSEVIRGGRVIIATGTVPAVPAIDGLAECGYITNREAVNLESLPRRLVVLGAGPIGLEFAQIFRRFGSEVTVIEHHKAILPREDTEIAALAAGYLAEEGINILCGANAHRVEMTESGSKRVHVTTENGSVAIECDQILVATGRLGDVSGLGIEAAGVRCKGRSLEVDHYLRTNVPHILGAGDVCGGYLFTHVASYEGRLAALNAFTDSPEPFDHRVVPRCTFIDPEVASIGLTETEARDRGLDVNIHSFGFENLDRAILHGDARGVVKLIVDPLDGQIIGAHLIGPDASSIIAELAICMKHHLPISAIADTMHAYPSFPEAVEAAAMEPCISPVPAGQR